MIIQYEDITLRAIEEEDLELLKDMINDPEIENMTGGYSFPVSTYQQKKWFENLSSGQNELRLIIEVANHGAIGVFMLTDIDWKNKTAQTHIKIANNKEFRAKGYGAKAYKLLIKYAFEQLNLNCIYNYTLEYNTILERTKERWGFKKDGVLRERVYKNGQYHNLIAWSLLKGEFHD